MKSHTRNIPQLALVVSVPFVLLFVTCGGGGGYFWWENGRRLKLTRQLGNDEIFCFFKKMSAMTSQFLLTSALFWKIAENQQYNLTSVFLAHNEVECIFCNFAGYSQTLFPFLTSYEYLNGCPNTGRLAQNWSVTFRDNDYVEKWVRYLTNKWINLVLAELMKQILFRM